MHTRIGGLIVTSIEALEFNSTLELLYYSWDLITIIGLYWHRGVYSATSHERSRSSNASTEGALDGEQKIWLPTAALPQYL